MGLTGRETVFDGRRLARIFAAFAFVALAFMFLAAAPAWAAPELRVTKTGDPNPVVEGEVLTYTIVVRNAGTDPATDTATDVDFIDDLPDATAFVSASTTAGACDDTPDPGDPGTNPVICELGDIAPGESVTVTIEVRPTDASASPLINTARAEDSPTIFDEDTTTTRVVPNLVIEKIDEPERVNTGGLITYTLRVTNEGQSAANNVVVIDDLPLDDVDYRSVESAAFRCTETAGLVKCTRASLADGETRKIEIVVKAKEEGTVSNTARVSADGVRVDEDTEETRVENASTTGTNTTTSSSGTNSSGTNTSSTNSSGTNTSTGDPQVDSTSTSGTSTSTTTSTTSSSTGDPQTGVIKGTIPKGTLANTGGASGTMLLFGMALLFAGAATWTFRRFF